MTKAPSSSLQKHDFINVLEVDRRPFGCKQWVISLLNKLGHIQIFQSFYMCRIKLSMDFTFQIVTCVTKYTKSRKYYTRVSSKNNRNQLVFYFLISGIIFLIRISFFLKRFSTMIEPEEKCPYHVPSKRKHWTLL